MLGEAGLPIDDYNALSASDILAMLDWLSPSELGAVSRYEREHKQRVSILRRIDKLAVPSPDDMVIDLRDRGAGSCLLCGQAVESPSGFIVHLKDVHGLADDPGFESSLPNKLFAPVTAIEEDAPVVRRSPVLERVQRVETARLAAPPAPAPKVDEPTVHRAGPVVDPYESPATRMAHIAAARQPASAWREVARSSWLWLAGFALVFVLVGAGVLLLLVE